MTQIYADYADITDIFYKRKLSRITRKLFNHARRALASDRPEQSAGKNLH